VAYGTVFVADWAGDVHAVDADSGDRVWQADPGGQYVTGSVAVDDAAVYVGNTARNPIDDPTTNYAKMFRFDRTDGEIEWEFETTATEIGSSPVVTDGSLYFGTHRQTADSGPTVGVYGLTTDGREEWFREFGGRGVGSSPALLEGTLYFGGTDGSVYALE
jgi:outer membrane protein assembly factor BamB